ncbi:MAG: deoxyhypusine synthase family protein [Bryobacter sp.]|jgi:deoxyhypusine synthase|nr:deoxyhypusine synthase family protein [Bryobacter sp. CoA8 C33]
MSQHPTPPKRTVLTRRVDQCQTLDEVFRHCLPAFGGAFLRRLYSILDTAIGMGCPLTVAIAGPVTVSGQHQTWLLPLLETGWVAYLSTTDAVCYHDGHRSLNGHRDPVHEVPIFGDDGALRDERTIRVTDMAFDEDVLLDQDRFLTAMLQLPDFQHKMTGTELRHLLGRFYSAQERSNGVEEGLLAACHRLAIPVFVGAPGDGSVFLNSMKLWAMRKAGLIDEYGFDLDLHAEVFEACAYHYWGLFQNPVQALATLVLGGGVPKNFNLQPEPALGQILGLPNVRGYNFDVQIVTAPVTDGSLSSCFPAEAVTWGKVDKDTYTEATESLQCDYSLLMPFLVKALLDNRARYEHLAAEIGEEQLFAQHPQARGYLRPRSGYRLFEKRDELVRTLTEAVQLNRDWLMEGLTYPLAR